MTSTALPDRIGPYRIDRELGRGGMGVVFLGHDPRLDRRVAIKTLPEGWNDEARRRFDREARTLGQLNHPNVATVYELGEWDGSHFLAMEYIDGPTLREVLDESAPLPFADALDVALQVATGLAAAHERNVIHRDLKPRNVMRTSDGRVKILDFGLAKSIAPEETIAASAGITEGGRLLGTVGYMAPEQLRGEAVDARCDVFAFGVLLYELLTGRRPFAGTTRADLASSVLRDDPPPMHDLGNGAPSALQEILDRCLAKDRDGRYDSARPLLADLRRAPQQSVPGPGGSSIAVLPFANLSADPDNELFTDGLAEEILNSLSRIELLRVAARTSSFAFRGRNEDVRKIGRELGVRTVLEGSVRRSGERLRVTAQLINVEDGYHLWSDRFDRTMEDVFELQDEIAENIAAALQVILSQREKVAITSVKAKDHRAYDLYLRGTQVLHRTTTESLERAKALFRRAIEVDPEYPLGYTGLAMTCGTQYMWIEPRPELLDEADRASGRALELAPDLAASHVARGLAHSNRGRFPDAQVSFMRALDMDPRNWDAHYYYARACVAEGMIEKAARLFREASAIRPDDFQAPTLLVLSLNALGRTEDKQRVARNNICLIERHLELYPDDVRAVYFLANNWSEAGDEERALAFAERALAMDPEEPGVCYNVACVYVHHGRVEEALDLLEQNVSHRWGYRSWIENDPDFAGVRDHPRFRAILKQLDQRDA